MIDCEYLTDLVESLYRGYAVRKEDVENAFERRLLTVPEYAKVKYELKACVFDLKTAVAFGDKEKVERLEMDKKSLEEKLGVIRSSMKVETLSYAPRCAVCGDTGVVGGGRCDCYYDNLSKAAYTYLGVAEPILSGFSDNALTDDKSLARVEKFKAYCDKLSEKSKNLLFIGQRGTGKTFFAKAITKAVNENKKNALFLNAFALNDVLLKLTFSKGREYYDINRILTTCDLITLDDLGSAPVLKNVTAEGLLSVITQRQEAGKPYIVTTNLTLGEISEKFGERVFSRMCGKSSVKITFTGNDLRISDAL